MKRLLRYKPRRTFSTQAAALAEAMRQVTTGDRITLHAEHCRGAGCTCHAWPSAPAGNA